MFETCWIFHTCRWWLHWSAIVSQSLRTFFLNVAVSSTPSSHLRKKSRQHQFKSIKEFLTVFLKHPSWLFPSPDLLGGGGEEVLQSGGAQPLPVRQHRHLEVREKVKKWDNERNIIQYVKFPSETELNVVLKQTAKPNLRCMFFSMFLTESKLFFSKN